MPARVCDIYCLVLRLAPVLPDGVDAVADVVEDVVAGGAVAGGQEAADDALDVAAQAELLRVVHALALHAEAEAAYLGQDDGVAVGEFHLQRVLQVGHHGHYGRLVVAARQERLAYH